LRERIKELESSIAAGPRRKATTKDTPLAQAQDIVAAAFQCLSVAVAITDAGVIVAANNAFCTLVGADRLPRRAQMSEVVPALAPPASLEDSSCATTEVVLNGRVLRVLTWSVASSGRTMLHHVFMEL
jgi:PAS domain-containing protein